MFGYIFYLKTCTYSGSFPIIFPMGWQSLTFVQANLRGERRRCRECQFVGVKLFQSEVCKLSFCSFSLMPKCIEFLTKWPESLLEYDWKVNVKIWENSVGLYMCVNLDEWSYPPGYYSCREHVHSLYNHTEQRWITANGYNISSGSFHTTIHLLQCNQEVNNLSCDNLH